MWRSNSATAGGSSPLGCTTLIRQVGACATKRRTDRSGKRAAREAVRDLTHEQIENVVGYLSGDRDTLDTTVDLRPVLDDIDDLAQIYFGDLVASVQNRTEPDFEAFDRAGLSDLVFTPSEDPSDPWPTLGEMIGSGRRLVVFAEEADGPADWYRNFYHYGMETPFSFRSPDEMSCEPHRGGTGKRLFLLNHFITSGGGSRLDAGEVNTEAYVLDRVERCERERGRPVNFVAIDYTTIGDAQAAVDELNARR